MSYKLIIFYVQLNQTMNNSYRLIKHGNWEFEYKPKNIFTTDVESFDKKLFCAINTNTTNTISNTNLTEADLEDFRKAALIHKMARKKARSMLCPGSKLSDLVSAIEDMIINLTRNDKTYFELGNKTQGIAFPVGVNINNVIAHDSKTTMIYDSRKFYKGDVVKVDIGVHVNGRIIDSAFTEIITDKGDTNTNIYDSVLEASRDSVFSAIKIAGPDQLLFEMSEFIAEIIGSYEVDLGDSSLEIKPVKGIGGHNINQYAIHGGKLILSEPDHDVQGDSRMLEDEIYAIETYASTGYGIMTQNQSMEHCTHYMENMTPDMSGKNKHNMRAFKKTDMSKWLNTRQGLPFSSSWINGNNGNNSHKISNLTKGLRLGIDSGVLIAYPPLYDEENSVVAQFEHTIHVKDGSVEIFSLGDDY